MTEMETAFNALTEYGYGLTDDGNIITPDGEATHLRIISKHNRVQVRHGHHALYRDGALYWSGPPERIGEFVEQFWFAKKVNT